MKPTLLAVVRHGEAEHNHARKQSKAGDHSFFEGAFGDRSNFKSKLTTQGRSQLQTTGKWMRGNGLALFDRYYCSEAIRAMESAAQLGLPNASWSLEHILREQDAGIMCTISEEQRRQITEEIPAHLLDSMFFFRPKGSESVADMVENRIESFLRRLADNDYETSICVCHGRFMDGLRFRLRHMTVHEWEEQDTERNERHRIGNGQVHLYSRRHPATNELTKFYRWFKSVRPTDLSHSSNTETWKGDGIIDGWVPSKLRRFSNEELLGMASKVPQLIDN